MGRPWTAREDVKLADLCADGFTNRKIAEVLCRTRGSISTRIQEKRITRGCRKSEPEPLRRVVISRVDVITYYELGWRFVGFKGDLCMFEWQSEREPRWPEQMREAA